MVANWVKQMTREVVGQTLQEGMVTTHPDGRVVRITGGGDGWSEFGWSGWFEWREVLEDGTFGPKESGYGWSPTK